MLIKCSYSGLEFKVSDFNLVKLTKDRKEVHPIFNTSLDQLSNLYTDYLNGRLTRRENYLLFLRLLDSTGLIIWNTSINLSSISDQKLNHIIANNYQSLFIISTKLSACKHPSFLAPSVVISEQNNDLDNVRDWIELWNVAYTDFINGLKESQFLDNIRKKEIILAKFIKSPQIPEEKYSHVLADWAALAANFPPICAPEWKALIIACYTETAILEKDQCDLEDLIAHCETNIDEYSTGSIFSHALFTCLSTGLSKLTDFYGNNSIHSTGFTQLDINKPEDAIRLKMIESAPMEQPIRLNYVSNFEYLKARMKYNLAIRYAEKTSSLTQANESPNNVKEGEL